MDIALALEGSGESIDQILTRHSINEVQLALYNADSVFLKKVGFLREEIQENGMTFRMKARAQAEELLVTSWTLIHSPEVSASVKADLIKSTVKWGDLEPKASAIADGGAGGVTIQINVPVGGQVAEQPPKIIENVP